MWETCLVLLLCLSSPPGEFTPDANATDAEIVALYPNTVQDYDRGEFIVVHLPHRTNLSTWVFRDDDDQRAKPPPIEVNGTVAFSTTPAVTEELIDIPVIELGGWFQLADDGEAVTLEVDGRPVDQVAYTESAPQAHLWIRDRPDPWRPLGATSFDAVTGRGDATTFVLPDDPHVVTALLANATRRLYLGGYELGDPAITDALLAAAERGVDVAVHAEGRPVGGITVPAGNALDTLADAGIAVTVHWGPYRRWGVHHPKYVVVDDRLLVMTENFKRSGTGGEASRGWGVIMDEPRLADAATAIFHADSTWRDAYAWSEVRDDVERFTDNGETGTFETIHTPTEVEEVSATLLVAPDNAEKALTELVRNATRSIDILQVSIGDIDFPLLAEAIDRAREGVRVRVLLSDRWYARDGNQVIARELEAIATEEDLDISIRLVDDTDRFNRIHAKGIIVDETVAVVGSINWNNHSLRENREMAVILRDERVAGYYLDVFEGDWQTEIDPPWQLPIALLVVAVVTGGLTAIHASRLRIDGPVDTSNDTTPKRSP